MCSRESVVKRTDMLTDVDMFPTTCHYLRCSGSRISPSNSMSLYVMPRWPHHRESALAMITYLQNSMRKVSSVELQDTETILYNLEDSTNDDQLPKLQYEYPNKEHVFFRGDFSYPTFRSHPFNTEKIENKYCMLHKTTEQVDYHSLEVTNTENGVASSKGHWFSDTESMCQSEAVAITCITNSSNVEENIEAFPVTDLLTVDFSCRPRKGEKSEKSRFAHNVIVTLLTFSAIGLSLIIVVFSAVYFS